jgi:hypothetical protein
MKVRILIVAAAAATLQAATASAGVFSDDLAKCLVAKAAPADRAALLQWMFTAMSANPAVTGLSNVTPAQRAEHTKAAGLLFQRLMLDDCHKETVVAVKNEGVEAVRQSFGVLGQVAMRDLMNDPAVQKDMAGLGSSLDKARWAELAKEIGVSPESITGTK